MARNGRVRVPADRGLVALRLERAQREGLLVRLGRRTTRFPSAGGFVVAIGRKWVALADLNDQVMLDGWSVLRLRDVRAVTIEPDPACFEVRALQARDLWPVLPLELELDDFESTVRSAVEHSPIIGVSTWPESADHKMGLLESVDKHGLTMRLLSRRNRWARNTDSFLAEDIIRLHFGGASSEVPTLVAGPAPRRQSGLPTEEERKAMAAKSRRVKPAVVRAELAEAMAERRFLTVHRSIPGADKIDGYVVSIGTDWVALATLNNGVEYDGWTLLRLKDVKRLSGRSRSRQSIETVVLKARSAWPPQAPPVRLDSFGEVVDSIVTMKTLASVFIEHDMPDACWIGSMSLADEQTLRLVEVDTRARWNREARLFDAEDVTRFDLEDGYIDALRLVAGVVPPSDVQ